jgi:hypothetical protein
MCCAVNHYSTARFTIFIDQDSNEEDSSLGWQADYVIKGCLRKTGGSLVTLCYYLYSNSNFLAKQEELDNIYFFTRTQEI